MKSLDDNFLSVDGNNAGSGKGDSWLKIEFESLEPKSFSALNYIVSQFKVQQNASHICYLSLIRI